MSAIVYVPNRCRAVISAVQEDRLLAPPGPRRRARPHRALGEVDVIETFAVAATT